MKSEHAVITMRKILEKPSSTDDPTAASEKLVNVVCVVLSLDDAELQEVIFHEAKNRMMIGKAVGKNPWEMTP